MKISKEIINVLESDNKPLMVGSYVHKKKDVVEAVIQAYLSEIKL